MRKPHTPMTRMHPCMMVAAGGVRTTPDIMPRSFHDGRNVAVRLNSSVQMGCVVHLFDHMESSAARMSCLVSQHSMHAAVGQSGTVARAWYLNASLSPLVNLPLQPCQLLEAHCECFRIQLDPKEYCDQDGPLKFCSYCNLNG